MLTYSALRAFLSPLRTVLAQDSMMTWLQLHLHHCLTQETRGFRLIINTTTRWKHRQFSSVSGVYWFENLILYVVSTNYYLDTAVSAVVSIYTFRHWHVQRNIGPKVSYHTIVAISHIHTFPAETMYSRPLLIRTPLIQIQTPRLFRGALIRNSTALHSNRMYSLIRNFH